MVDQLDRRLWDVGERGEGLRREGQGDDNYITLRSSVTAAGWLFGGRSVRWRIFRLDKI